MLRQQIAALPLPATSGAPQHLLEVTLLPPSSGDSDSGSILRDTRSEKPASSSSSSLSDEPGPEELLEGKYYLVGTRASPRKIALSTFCKIPYLDGRPLSMGSAFHDQICTPCKFRRHHVGCRDGKLCNFCHYPHTELSRSAVRRAHKFRAGSLPWNSAAAAVAAPPASEAVPMPRFCSPVVGGRDEKLYNFSHLPYPGLSGSASSSPPPPSSTWTSSSVASGQVDRSRPAGWPASWSAPPPSSSLTSAAASGQVGDQNRSGPARAGFYQAPPGAPGILYIGRSKRESAASRVPNNSAARPFASSAMAAAVAASPDSERVPMPRMATGPSTAPRMAGGSGSSSSRAPWEPSSSSSRSPWEPWDHALYHQQPYFNGSRQLAPPQQPVFNGSQRVPPAFLGGGAGLFNGGASQGFHSSRQREAGRAWPVPCPTPQARIVGRIPAGFGGMPPMTEVPRQARPAGGYGRAPAADRLDATQMQMMQEAPYFAEEARQWQGAAREWPP